MTEIQTPSDNAADAEQANVQNKAPSFRVLTQYVKDLSFENPQAPFTFVGQPTKNEGAVSLSVHVKTLDAKTFGDSTYEVELKIALSNQHPETQKTTFVVDISYCGVFQIQNVPQQALEPALYVECPRLLFPFCRAIIASTTQAGGYPSVLMDPVDFFAIYQQQLLQRQAEASESKTQDTTAA